MSGCPMFKWYTLIPLSLALSANGTSLRMGEEGIAIPFSEICGISYLSLNLSCTNIGILSDFKSICLYLFVER